MTFIVAASTNDIAIHVADTLLTKRDGSFYADDLVKTTIVHCKDAAHRSGGPWSDDDYDVFAREHFGLAP
jgi:hypothetical protein